MKTMQDPRHTFRKAGNSRNSDVDRDLLKEVGKNALERISK